MLGLSWRFYTKLTDCSVSDDFDQLLANQPNLTNIDEVFLNEFSEEMNSLESELLKVLDQQFTGQREVSTRSQQQ